MKVVKNTNNNFYNVSQKIKLYRKVNNLTQKEFAELIGVTKNSVSQYESCSQLPTIDTLIKIAGLFKVSLDDLLDLNTPTDNYTDFSEIVEEAISLKGLTDKQKSSIKLIVSDLRDFNNKDN